MSVKIFIRWKGKKKKGWQSLVLLNWNCIAAGPGCAIIITEADNWNHKQIKFEAVPARKFNIILNKHPSLDR